MHLMTPLATEIHPCTDDAQKQAFIDQGMTLLGTCHTVDGVSETLHFVANLGAECRSVEKVYDQPMQATFRQDLFDDWLMRSDCDFVGCAERFGKVLYLFERRISPEKKMLKTLVETLQMAQQALNKGTTPEDLADRIVQDLKCAQALLKGDEYD